MVSPHGPGTEASNKSAQQGHEVPGATDSRRIHTDKQAWWKRWLQDAPGKGPTNQSASTTAVRHKGQRGRWFTSAISICIGCLTWPDGCAIHSSIGASSLISSSAPCHPMRSTFLAKCSAHNHRPPPASRHSRSHSRRLTIAAVCSIRRPTCMHARRMNSQMQEGKTRLLRRFGCVRKQTTDTQFVFFFFFFWVCVRVHGETVGEALPCFSLDLVGDKPLHGDAYDDEAEDLAEKQHTWEAVSSGVAWLCCSLDCRGFRSPCSAAGCRKLLAPRHAPCRVATSVAAVAIW